MKRHACILLVVMTAVAMFGIAGAAHPLGGPGPRAIRWAGTVNIPWSGRVNILHAPDNRWTPLDPALTLSDFGPAMRYPDLAGLLADVPAGDLARADVIAFEGNGGGTAGIDNGWESGVWTFSDGVNTLTVSFDECLGASGSDPRVVATGSVRGPDGTIFTGGSAYSAFFGMCSASPSGRVVAYILFDLHSLSPAIDVDSPSFSIRMENFPIETPGLPACPYPARREGTPDPDAVGVLSMCSGK